MKSNLLKSVVVAGVTAATLSFAAPPASAMNQEELIARMGTAAGISNRDARQALLAFVEVTTSALKIGDRVSIPGFGVFTVATQAARTGRNPRTGRMIKIEAKRVVKFKAGGLLSSKIN